MRSLEIAAQRRHRAREHRARSRHRLRQDAGAERRPPLPDSPSSSRSACRCWSAPRASASSTRSRPRRPTSGSAARSPPTCLRSQTAPPSSARTTSPRPCRRCASPPRSGTRDERCDLHHRACLHAYHGVMQHEAKVGQTFSHRSRARDRPRPSVALRQARRHGGLRSGRRHPRARHSARSAIGWSKPPPAAVADAVLGCVPAGRTRCAVTVHKPHAPIAATFADVGVTSCARADAMAEALLALGGNVGDVRATLDRAVAMLCERRHSPASRARRIPDAALGRRDQPRSSTCASRSKPHLRRTRCWRAHKQWSARSGATAPTSAAGVRGPSTSISSPTTISTLHNAGSMLPHPRLFERAFVLVPLAEIAPEQVIGGIRMSDALAGVDTKGVLKLPPRS